MLIRVSGLTRRLFSRAERLQPCRRLAWMVIVMLAISAGAAYSEQTIVFFRHGEKPSGGYGQLTCQGLNRALALPAVLTGMFGAAKYAYAPNPAVKISEPAGSFYYVRPLAAIEPTAIRLGLSVNTRYGYTDVAGLQNVLINPAKDNTTSFVAWEHSYLVKAVQNIMNAYGGRAVVPAWTSGDYDSLYVVRINYGSTAITARFERDREGLNNLPTSCP
jgi:hypothetical protein